MNRTLTFGLLLCFGRMSMSFLKKQLLPVEEVITKGILALTLFLIFKPARLHSFEHTGLFKGPIRVLKTAGHKTNSSFQDPSYYP